MSKQCKWISQCDNQCVITNNIFTNTNSTFNYIQVVDCGGNILLRVHRLYCLISNIMLMNFLLSVEFIENKLGNFLF